MKNQVHRFNIAPMMDWNDTRPSGEILDQGLFAALALRGQRGPLDPAYGNAL